MQSSDARLSRSLQATNLPTTESTCERGRCDSGATPPAARAFPELAVDLDAIRAALGGPLAEEPTAPERIVQREGTCWLGATSWQGKRYMRISVSNAMTTEADVDRAANVILAANARERRGHS